MGNKSKFKRFWAIALTAAMTLQQSGYTSFAEDETVPAQVAETAYEENASAAVPAVQEAVLPETTVQQPEAVPEQTEAAPEQTEAPSEASSQEENTESTVPEESAAQPEADETQSGVEEQEAEGTQSAAGEQEAEGTQSTAEEQVEEPAAENPDENSEEESQTDEPSTDESQSEESAPEEESEEQEEFQVTFQAAGASVFVAGEDVTGQQVPSVEKKIEFSIVLQEGFELDDVTATSGNLTVVDETALLYAVDSLTEDATVTVTTTEILTLPAKSFDLGISSVEIYDDPEDPAAYLVKYDTKEYRNVAADGEIVLSGVAAGNRVVIDTAKNTVIRLKGLSLTSGSCPFELLGIGASTVILEGRNTILLQAGGYTADAAMHFADGKQINIMSDPYNRGSLVVGNNQTIAVLGGSLSLNAPLLAEAPEGCADVAATGIAMYGESIVAEINGTALYPVVIEGLEDNTVYTASVYVNEEPYAYGNGTYTSINGKLGFQLPEGSVKIEIGEDTYVGENKAGGVVLEKEEYTWEPVQISFSAVDENGEVISEDYQGLECPAFEEELDLTETPLTEDVTRVVNVEGTNRQYLETYKYQKQASIAEGNITSVKKVFAEEAAETEEETAEFDYVCLMEDGSEVVLEEDTEIELSYSLEYKKTRYVYRDGSIVVKATVEKADAIPDDARFIVTQILPGSEAFTAYLEALNNQAEDIAAQKGEEDSVSYDEKNTLLYDIGFFVPKYDPETETVIDDQYVEIKPAEGAVRIQFNFRKNQLEDQISAEKADDITVIHLPVDDAVLSQADSTKDAMEGLQAADISATVVACDSNEPAQGENGLSTIEFTADSFSAWAVSGGSDSITVPAPEKAFPESDLNLLKIGDFQYLANFGLIGFSEITVNQHICSNLVTDKLIIKNGNGLGTNDKGQKTPEVLYIGSEIIHDPTVTSIPITLSAGSMMVFGKNIQGEFLSGGNDSPFSIKIGGVTFAINDNSPKYTEENGEKIAACIMQEDDEHQYISIQEMRELAEGISLQLAENTASDVTKKSNSDGGVEIIERGTNTIACINLKASETTSKMTVDDSHALQTAPHVLLINIDAEGEAEVNIPGLVVSGNNVDTLQGEVDIWSNLNVIVNVIDSTSPDGLFHGIVANNTTQIISGSIIAPAATVMTKGNVNGQIIADKIIINEEFHRDSITFTNAITVTGGLKVAKTINGSSECDEFFNFKITPLNGAPGPEGCNSDGTKIAENQVDGLVSFGYLNFESLGDYDYLVEELHPDDAVLMGDGNYYKNKIIYDGRKYIITVHTAPRSSSSAIGIGGYSVYEYVNGTKGEKVSELTYDEGKQGVVTFENGKDPIKLNFKVKKAVDGDWKNKTFSFELKQTEFISKDGQTITFTGASWDSHYKMPLVNWQPAAQVTAIAREKTPTATFATISNFTDEGTYVYTITENYPSEATVSDDGKTATTDDGFVYDITPHEVKVVISRITENSSDLKATVTYDGKKNLVITNKGPEKPTPPAPSKITVTATKVWSNADETTTPPNGAQVVFTLFADGVSTGKTKTLNATNGWTATFTDLDEYKADGQTKINYTVKETTTWDGYTPTPEAVSDKGTITNIEIVNSGELELTKTIKGDLTEDEIKGALTFTVSTKVTENGKEVTKYLAKDGSLKTEAQVLTVGSDFTKDSTGKYVLLIKNVEAGSYTVTETTEQQDGTRMAVTYKVGSGAETAGTEAQAEVKKGEKTTAEFADDFTKLGQLELTKTIKGDITEEEAEGALRFEVKTKDGKWLKADGTLSETKVELTLKDFTHTEGTKEYTLKLDNVKIGEYTVTETTKDVTGKDVTVSYTVTKEGGTAGTAVTGDAATAGVEKGKTTTVAFEDDYTTQTEETGNLELKKTIKGDITEEEAEGALRFEVKTKDGKWLKADGTLSETKVELTLKDFTHTEGTKEYTLKLDNVRIGDYTVTETTKDVTGKDVTVSYTVTKEGGAAGTAVTGDAATAGVEKGKTTTVAFEDDYTTQTEETGNLELKKTIKGDITEEEAEGALRFEVKTKDGKWLKADGTLSETKVELTLKDFTHTEGTKEYTLKLSNVKIGDYTVTETTKDVTGKDVTVSYTVTKEGGAAGTAVTGDAATAGVEQGKTTTVAFEDDYTNQINGLIITKSVKGGVTQEEAEGALTFTIYNETTGEYLLADGKTTTDKAKAEQTLKDLSKAPGYKVTGNAENGFLFEVKFDNVAAGDYVVTETNAAIPGFTVTHAIEKAEQTLAGGSSTTIELKDEYKKNETTGSLTITKSVKGGVTQEEAEGALTFTIYNETTGEYLLADGKTTTDKAKAEQTLKELSKADGYKVTGNAENGFLFEVKFNNVAAGDYVVTETNAAIPGFTVTHAIEKAEQTLAGGGSATIELKDEYKKNETTGSLTITKSVKGGVTQEEAEGALTFTIYNETTEEYLLADGTTTKDKAKAEQTLKDLSKATGYKVTGNAENGFLFEVKFDNVAAGDYVVTETNAAIPGFTITSAVEKGEKTLAGGGEATIELKDEYTDEEIILTTGDLIITKSVKGGVTQEEAEGALTFTIYNETTGEYLLADGTMTTDKTKAEQTLKDLSKADGYKVTGNAENGFLFEVKFEDVKAGIYTVTETNAAIEGFTLTTSIEEESNLLNGGSSATIELKDEYEEIKTTGDLVIIKSVKGGVTQEEAEGALTFTILNKTTGEYLLADGTTTKDATKAEQSLKDLSNAKGYKVTGDAENGFLFEVKFEGVAEGDYVVTETNAAIPGFKLVSAVEKDEEALEGGKSATIELEDEYEAIKTTGDLVIIKSVKGGVTQEEAEGALTFTILNKTTGEYLLADGTTTKDATKAEQSLKDLSKAKGYKVTGDAENGFLFEVKFEGVAEGDYVVTETNAAIPGFKLVSAVEKDEEALEGGKSATIELEDEYEAIKTTGDLVIIKSVKGGVTQEEAEGALTFTILNKTTGEYLLADGTTTKDETKAEQSLKDLSKAKGYKVTGDAENGFLFEVKFEGVAEGDYVVTETNAAIPGFQLVSAVEQGEEALLGGKEATIELKDEYEETETETLTVSISKVDIADGEELEGAKIQLLDKDGNIVEEWISTTEAHEITGLKAGEEYTLRETVAPEGYDIATDTIFVLKEDGTIDADKTTTKTSEEGILLVEDSKKRDTGAELSVTKALTTLAGEDINAVDQTFLVQLFYDEECTEAASDVKKLEFKNAHSSTVTFDVEKGQTYYVAEVSEANMVIQQGQVNGVDYLVNFMDGNEVSIKEDSDGTTVFFNNEFVRIPDGFYKEGELTITKEVLTSAGQKKTTDETFYAGIFEDAALTKLSDIVDNNILPLDLAGGSEVTASTKVQVAVGGSYTLYIAEVDKSGKPVKDNASFKYEASYDKSSVTITEENLNADVKITNKEKAAAATPTPTITSAPGGSSAGNSARTGDSTDIAGWFAMLALAGILMLIIAFRKRQKM